MSDDTQEAVADGQIPQLEAPPHSWGGLAVGFVGLLLLCGATLALASQFVSSRPMDLKLASLGAAEAVGDLLLTHLVPSENILVSEPELTKTPSAHYFQFKYDVLLPDTLSLGGMAKLLERDLLPQGVLTTLEPSGSNRRSLRLSVGDFSIGTVNLSRTPLPQSQPKAVAIVPDTSEPPAEPPLQEAKAPSSSMEDAQEAEASKGLVEEAQPEEAPETEKVEVEHRGGWRPPTKGSLAAREARKARPPRAWKVADHAPRLAIIVDDGGYGGTSTDVILGLTTRLTFAILPNTPYGTVLAREATALGFEILLHMPMENTDGGLRHEGQIETDMNESDIQRLLTDALSQVPGAVGVNNHMGSKFTAHADVLSFFMEDTLAEGLFFIDSRTTPDSVAYDVATEHGVPSASRDLFLDHDNDRDEIRGRFRQLMATARRDGSAIGICHFRPNTALVLREMLPELRLGGIELVHVSELVK